MSLCQIYNGHTKTYLRSFFIALNEYYGPISHILNAHHLIHVADDVTSMGCNLTITTTFAFESFLGKIKKMLSTPNRSLAQVCRRPYEKRMLRLKKQIIIPPLLEMEKIDKEYNVMKIRYKQFTITNESPDNMILLQSGTIASIRKMYSEAENLKIECQVWQKKKPVFTYPCNSKYFSIWNLHSQPLSKVINCPISLISKKLVKLQVSSREGEPDKVYVISLLHEI